MTSATRTRSRTRLHPPTQVRPRVPRWRVEYDRIRTHWTVIDFFAGMGGSSTGLMEAGFEVVHASNHNEVAIATHQENHPDTWHSQCDLTAVEPQFFPWAHVMWASPECKNHSVAKGKQRESPQMDLWGERLGFDEEDDEADLDPKVRERKERERARRSRAMMEDVVRMVEYNVDKRRRPYKYVVVENVPQVADWIHFSEWKRRMIDAGYSLEILSLNSAHAHGRNLAWEGVAQDRNRVYIIATLNGMPKPDLEVRPPCWCPNCEHVVEGKRRWKDTAKTRNRDPRQIAGTYGKHGQYVYECPDVYCKTEVVPYQKPAAAVLNFADTGRTIGEWKASKRPPAEATLRRIEHGVNKYMMPVLFSTGGREHPARSIFDPSRTLTTRHEDAIALPPEFYITLRGGGSRESATSVADPLGTATTSGGRNFGFVQPPGGATRLLTPTSAPAGPLSWISTYNNNGDVRAVNEPLSTMTLADRQALIQATAKARAQLQAIVEANEGRTEKLPQGFIDDCTYRMLTPEELADFMGMPKGYVMLGSKRDRAMGLGNAVTPPAARWIGERIIEALEGSTIAPPAPQLMLA